MPGGFLRRGKRAQGGDAGAGKIQAGWIEIDQGVAHGYHDLPISSRRKGKETRGEPVEKRESQRGIALARERNKQLAARGVGRQASRVSARVQNQNPEPAKDGVSRIRWVCRSFPCHHLAQALDGASTAADAAALKVRHHHQAPDLGQLSDGAPQLDLRPIRLCLKIV